MGAKESDSVADLARRPIAGFAAGPGGGAVWLDGGKPVTACPKCRGAMSVRIWLSLAECPRCNLTIRLSDTQEKQALALSRPCPSAPAAGQDALAAAPQPTAIEPVATAASDAGNAPPIAQPSHESPNGSVAVSPTVAPRQIGDAAPDSPLADPLLSSVARSGRFFVCWLVSAVLHMVLVIVLGFWLIENSRRSERLLLAATVSDVPSDTTVEQLDMSAEEPKSIEEALPINATVPPATDETLVASVTSVEPPPGEILPGSDLKKLPVGNISPGHVLAGRDPALRGQLVVREGGTTESEAAVGRALEWLKRHQGASGSWSLNGFSAAGDCNGRCGDPGVESDTSATALALLPFLGAGQTHLRGEYTFTVARGLRALMDMQGADGDLRGRGSGNMYAHGQATIALCEAYALTQAENLREPAQRAVNFVVAAQHEAGGWRYRPGEPGDLSVVGWQMMALRSAQMAYLEVPQETFLKATRFLNSVQHGTSTGLYCYMPKSGPSPVMTAEGLLCRQYSGWRRNHPLLVNGVVWLEANQLPKRDRANMYFWYYGTQVMHHMGGEIWEKWNDALRDLLISLQSTSGHEAGSWAPLGGHDSQGGRLYTTALAACTLEVYYRHLPLYRGGAVGSDATPRHKP
ncbi:MAG TPA: prenyltransferase/squalene oxidase repeat-containing protein [Pirellulales bacterium]|nr:prenyltransferase/squalene oxidase repeat-containing protein [Pirellulales bacterium]